MKEKNGASDGDGSSLMAVFLGTLLITHAQCSFQDCVSFGSQF